MQIYENVNILLKLNGFDHLANDDGTADIDKNIHNKNYTVEQGSLYQCGKCDNIFMKENVLKIQKYYTFFYGFCGFRITTPLLLNSKIESSPQKILIFQYEITQLAQHDMLRHNEEVHKFECSKCSYVSATIENLQITRMYSTFNIWNVFSVDTKL